jgi:hypothetical protein
MDDARRARAQAREVEEIRPVVNVIVKELTALERYLPGGVEGSADSARVHHLPGSREIAAGAAAEAEEQVAGAEVGSSMRAVVPPMQSFGGGRRR